MRVVELRDLRWRGRSWREACGRISGSRFSFEMLDPQDLDLDANAPADLSIDGVPGRSLSIVAGQYGQLEVDVELVASLPLIEFTPYREFPFRAGELRYEEALLRVSSEHAVNAADIH